MEEPSKKKLALRRSLTVWLSSSAARWGRKEKQKKKERVAHVRWDKASCHRAKSRRISVTEWIWNLPKTDDVCSWPCKKRTRFGVTGMRVVHCTCSYKGARDETAGETKWKGATVCFVHRGTWRAFDRRADDTNSTRLFPLTRLDKMAAPCDRNVIQRRAKWPFFVKGRPFCLDRSRVSCSSDPVE